jgi:basic membrane protein A and related proteins
MINLDVHRRSVRSALRMLCVAVIAAACVGCGGASSSGGGSGDAGGGRTVKLVWLYYGPKNDGGYNRSQWFYAQPAIQHAFGSRVKQVDVDNIPYSAQASQITEQAIHEGGTLLVDTVAAGQLFTSVCAKYPNVDCIEPEAPGPYPNPADSFSSNVSTVAGEFWNPEYLMGMAAGLLTKSNTVGFVAPYNVPVVISSANAFELGCLKVNPQCRERMVITNDYFNPQAATQAANTLVNAGADVLHGWTDDPGFCRVGEQRGVRVIGQFFDYRNLCPNAYVSGVLWNYKQYYVDQVRAAVNGTWKGHQSTFLKLGEGADIAPWGKNVPANVRSTVGKMYDAIRAGANPFEGPIYDVSGKLRVPSGEHLTPKTLYNEWTWLVRGVVKG